MTCCFISRLPNDKNSNQCSQRLVMEFVLNVSSPAMFVLWFSMVQNQVVVLCSVKCWGMVWCCKVWYFTTRYLGRQGRLWWHVMACGMVCYGLVWYGLVWYGMVMLAGWLWSDYVRPVPSLPSPPPVPVTYVTPEHNADSVTTKSTTRAQVHHKATQVHHQITTLLRPSLPSGSSATACSFSQRIIEFLRHDPMLHCRV